MRYDFDALTNRKNTNSLKWDVMENELPMWVADMDFTSPPAVTEALVNRAKQGIFGYTIVPDRWYDAIINWWKTRHSFQIEKEWLCFTTGVVPAITSIIKRVTNVGDNVVLQTPVYDIFFHSVENTGRHVLENRLIYSDHRYHMDMQDLAEKLADPCTTMMILCNPHNPAGVIWQPEELAEIGRLCEFYGVTLLSDEIHCDIVEPDFSYIPFASIDETNKEISITCVSASKAFNIAGLQAAAVIVPNKFLREKVVRGLNSDEVAEPNCFAIDGTIAAFEQGGEWLDQAVEYLFENRRLAEVFIRKNLPMLELTAQHATYLMWIDCGKVTSDAEDLCAFLERETGLYLSAGNQYRGNGNIFVRMNLACPRRRLDDGLNRLKKGVLSYLVYGEKRISE